MKNARLFCAFLLVASAAACAAEPTSPAPGSPRHSSYIGGGYSTPDSTKTPPDSTTKR